MEVRSLMRSTLLFLLFCVSCVQAQPVPGPADDLVPVAPDSVIAVINGQKFTVAEFERLTQNLTPHVRNLAAQQPKAYLEQHGLTMTVLAEAEKMKLDQMSPYKEKLAETRRQILLQGMLSERNRAVTIKPEVAKAHFEMKKDQYRQAVVKVLFITRVTEVRNLSDGKVTSRTSPEEAKAKAESLRKKLDDGADFVKLAKEHSDDRATGDKEADFPFPIRAGSTNVPPEIKDAVLAAKAGSIVGPVEHDAGWYLFRVDSIGMPEFESVRADIEKELRDAAVRAWIDGMKAKTTVTLENEPFWKAFAKLNPETPKPVEEAK